MHQYELNKNPCFATEFGLKGRELQAELLVWIAKTCIYRAMQREGEEDVSQYQQI